MKSTQKLLFIILLCSISFSTVKATHIVGGELNYRCLSNNFYEISLTVFRDCQNGVPPFDAFAAVGVFDTSNTLVTQLLIPFMGDDTLNPTLFDSCLVIPPDVCVHRTTYIDTMFLPFTPGGYQLAYQRCCRNYTILNIQNPNQTGATYYTEISELALTTCNSNPVFNAWPPIYICAGEPIVFDHAATDIDGDSLVYELCAPFEGAIISNSMPQPPNPPPYDSIDWQLPFSTNNMMGGTDLLKINKFTGLLTGTPTQVGQYVVGICVKEYRNGVLISSTKRDFQYNVGTCGSLHSALFFAPEVVCDSTFTVNFNNQSNTQSTYLWNFGDLTTNADTSNVFSPSYTYPDTGQYIITLVAGVNESCSDTLIRVVSVQDATMNTDFDVIYEPCEDSAKVQLIDNSFNPDSPITYWNWIFWDGTVDTIQNPIDTISEEGFYQIILISASANGCSDLAVDTIYKPPFNDANFQASDVICDSILTVNFVNQSDTQSTYLWNFGDLTTNMDTSNSFSPSYTYPDTGQYVIILIAGAANEICIDTFIQLVHIKDETVIADFEAIYDVCEDSTQVQLIDNSFSPTASVVSWNWEFWNGEQDSIQNPTNTIYGRNFYPIILTTTFSNGCIDTIIDTILTNLVNISTTSTPQLCRGGEMFLEVFNLDSTDNLTYEWFPNEDILFGQNTEEAIVAPILTTDYWVEATNQFGCVGVDTIRIQASANFPTLDIVADVDSVFPGEPAQLMATNANYTYTWSPDSSLNVNGIYNPIANLYVNTTYTLQIEDENGCKNIDDITILIREFECELPYIFIPNAFTPNNDGENDVFYVRANSITEVYLAVYNRWGQKVFETRDLNQGWDGTFNGIPLEPDVFGYYLEIECFNGLKQFKKGNVALIR